MASGGDLARPHRMHRWSIARSLVLGSALSYAPFTACALSHGANQRSPSCSEPNDASSIQLPGTLSAELWQPQVGSTWQIVLSEPLDLETCIASSSSDTLVFDIDLFDNPRSTIQELHKRKKRVVCYFSAGSYENWRHDASEFNEADLGKPLSGWPGERWLDIRSPHVRSIMTERIALAAQKGCDAIDPDNIDGYQNENGLGLKAKDSLDYMHFLTSKAHAQNLAVGLKNSGALVKDLVDTVQFAVNEQCVVYSECATCAPFIKHEKPVFHIEYPSGAPPVSKRAQQKFCCHTNAARGSDGFSTVLKKMSLDEWLDDCSGILKNGCENGGAASSTVFSNSGLL